MSARPFESRIQDLVYNVDVGIGQRLIKFGLYLLFILGTMLMYTATQFHGFRDAEAMEYGQLARNMAQSGEMKTQCVRPLSLWYLSEHAAQSGKAVTEHPDILHPPVYPAITAFFFKITGVDFVVPEKGGNFPAEIVMIVICHVCTILTGLLVFLLARQLFDKRIAFFGVTIYFLSNQVWADSVSGLTIPLVTLLVTGACYAALLAISHRHDGRSPAAWIVPLVIATLLCILAFLTRYGAVVLLPCLALFVGLSIKEKGWLWAIALVAVFTIGISPWLIRNKTVSGGFLGLAPYTALVDSTLSEENTIERKLHPELQTSRVIDALQAKWLGNMSAYLDGDVRTIGDGLLVCLFLATFFYRFGRRQVHVFRWCVALAMLLLLFIAGLFGDATMHLMHMFWPIVILYGLAFFFLLLDRLQLSARIFSLSVVSIFVFISAAPLLLAILPPRQGIPYPPYFPPYIVHVSNLLEPDEIMCTDMPWATAWYGNRTSILVPQSIDEFYELNDYHKNISGIYFTTLTRNKPFARTLLTGTEQTWFPLLEGRIPGDFPLTQGFPLNNMDQLFLTDRPRWLE